MKITLLGTGTPAPSLTRQSSGYLIDVGGDLLVMDHGPGAHHRLLESGHRAVEVTHAFFSHLHYDHCMDYARLVLQRWDMGADQIPDLDVYGPTPIARMTDAPVRRGRRLRARTSGRGSSTRAASTCSRRAAERRPARRPAPRVTRGPRGRRHPGRGWTVTVGHAAHVQPQLECLAFRLDSDEGSVCYSGDSGACDELVELARGCDVLIHMNHHFSGTEPSAAIAPRAATTATTPRSPSGPA